MQPSNALHQLRQSPYRVKDPGSGKTIPVDRQFLFVALVAGASSETRKLAHPTKEGLFVTLALMTAGGGTITLTDSDGASSFDGTATSLTFVTAGDYLILESIPASATTYRWQVVRGCGVGGLTAVAASVTTLSASGGIGAFGATPPSSKPASANQAIVTQTQDALTDNSGGSASTTIAAISDTATKNAVASLVAELAKAKADVAGLITLTTALRAALVDNGTIKGSA